MDLQFLNHYESPIVEVIEVEVENGYQLSGEGGYPEPF